MKKLNKKLQLSSLKENNEYLKEQILFLIEKNPNKASKAISLMIHKKKN